MTLSSSIFFSVGLWLTLFGACLAARLTLLDFFRLRNLFLLCLNITISRRFPGHPPRRWVVVEFNRTSLLGLGLAFCRSDEDANFCVCVALHAGSVSRNACVASKNCSVTWVCCTIPADMDCEYEHPQPSFRCASTWQHMEDTQMILVTPILWSWWFLRWAHLEADKLDVRRDWFLQVRPPIFVRRLGFSQVTICRHSFLSARTRDNCFHQLGLLHFPTNS